MRFQLIKQKQQLGYNLMQAGAFNPFAKEDEDSSQINKLDSSVQFVCMDNIAVYGQILEIEEKKRNILREDKLKENLLKQRQTEKSSANHVAEVANAGGKEARLAGAATQKNAAEDHEADFVNDPATGKKLTKKNA